MLLRPNTIYKWDLHYEQAVRKTASFFRFRNNLGEMGFYRETIDFWVFAIGYWSSHWNEIRISGDLSSPLTRNRLSLFRRLLPNGIIVRNSVPRSSKKTDSSFSFRIGSSLVLLSLMISPFSSSFARGTILSIACACFSLSKQRSLSSIKRSAWRWSEESSINTHEHDAGHSINETADHFIIYAWPFSMLWGDSPTDPAVIDDRMVRTNQSHWIW